MNQDLESNDGLAVASGAMALASVAYIAGLVTAIKRTSHCNEHVRAYNRLYKEMDPKDQPP